MMANLLRDIPDPSTRATASGRGHSLGMGPEQRGFLRGRPERSAAKSKGDEVGAPGSARGTHSQLTHILVCPVPVQTIEHGIASPLRNETRISPGENKRIAEKHLLMHVTTAVDDKNLTGDKIALIAGEKEDGSNKILRLFEPA